MKLQSKLKDLYWAFMKKLSTNRVLRLASYLFDLETYRNPKIQRGLMFVAIITLTSLILVPRTLVPSVRYNVGDIASKDFKASKDYIIIDKEATDIKQKEAVNKVLTVYDLDNTSLNSTFEGIDSAFKFMRDISANTYGEDKLNALYKESRSSFSEILGIEIPDNVFNELVRQRFSPNFDFSIKILLEDMRDIHIVESRDTISSEIDRKGVILIDNQTGEEAILLNTDKKKEWRSMPLLFLKAAHSSLCFFLVSPSAKQTTPEPTPKQQHPLNAKPLTTKPTPTKAQPMPDATTPIFSVWL